MNEASLKKHLWKKGYTLDRVTRFKRYDRIRYHSKGLTVTIQIGKKLEQITEDDLNKWVIA